MRARTPRVLGLLTSLVGLVDLVGTLVRLWRPRLHEVGALLPGVVTISVSASILTGLALLVLGHGLRRRKRRAWRAVVVLLAVSAAAGAVHLSPVHAVVSVALLVVLVVRRGDFRAQGDPQSRWRAVRVFLGLLLADLVVGTAVVYAAERFEVGGAPSLAAALSEVAAGLVGLDGPVGFATHRAADLVGTVLAGLGLLTLAATAYVVLRSPEPRAVLSDDDAQRLRPLLRRGEDSLGYFALRTDKAVLWSPSGRAAVGYRVVGGVMLASGDPVGPSDAWPEAILAFQEQAAAHAWTVAVLGCSEQAGEAWAEHAGLDALELGDEAVLTTEDFTLEGRPMRNVRQMVSRVRRHGYETRVDRVGELEDGLRATVLADAAAWRGSETERGFSMALGRVADPRDPDAVLVTAWHEGTVRAMVQLVPWGADGLSLDLMRRDVDAAPGVNELLVAAVMEAAPRLGVTRVSLNFAAFRAVFERGERLGAGPLLRLRRSVLIVASRWFQIESLYRFNAKFQPEWQSRFLLYPGPGDLPRVSLAALEAEAFLVWPTWRRLREGQA
ncbi:phosphatidylglycerol lysyltransferase domain-containing protein [Lapillicoccus jejuensis]|uniref:phosphatidylglycerol lysyltransferase domain-containing protein n=1 Tax=Lapillicoccus jejuensis TaxID=402171 RepID=UPI0031D5D3AA